MRRKILVYLRTTKVIMWYNYGMHARKFRILLVIDTTHKSSIDILHGILSFSKERGNWTIDLRTGRSDEIKGFERLKDAYDGIIIKANPPANGIGLDSFTAPTITIDGDCGLSDARGELRCDNRLTAVTAATFLLEKKCKSYAVIGSRTKREYSEQRIRFFSEAIARANKPCRTFKSGSGTEQLRKWLLSLERPVGIFAVCDLRAREVLDHCHELKIDVPHEALILGVDDDELICETTSPTLSSIPLNTTQAGYRAAKFLDRIIREHLPQNKCTVIPYGGSEVIERQSTEHNFAIDELVSRCQETIAGNLGNHFTVNDLAKSMNCSRRYLELHFRHTFGHTPGKEILLQRTKRAIQLSKTSLPLAVIAEQCGFSDTSHMNKVFKRVYGKKVSAFGRSAKREDVSVT